MSISNKPILDFPIIFAPMEGITDENYRLLIQELYPDWDFLVSDFLRITRTNPYKEKHILKHYGKTVFENVRLKKKNILQVLTSYQAHHISCAQIIEANQIPWLDLNLGCPSKTVCKSEGGSFLLKDLNKLKIILKEIRDHYSGFFSAKIRTGFDDSSNFDQIINVINESGVDLITIHGRTREQLYKGKANWQLIKRAKELSSIPIIANGDIWSVKDIHQIKEETNCDGVMIARGALQSPWLARSFYNSELNENEELRRIRTREYIKSYQDKLQTKKFNSSAIHRQLKGLSRYLFLPLPNGEMIRQQLVRSKSLDDFNSIFSKLV